MQATTGAKLAALLVLTIALCLGLGPGVAWADEGAGTAGTASAQETGAVLEADGQSDPATTTGIKAQSGTESEVEVSSGAESQLQLEDSGQSTADGQSDSSSTTETKTQPATEPEPESEPEPEPEMLYSYGGNLMAVGGATRYDTMQKIVQLAFPDGSQGAIVASGEGWADAISSSGLAGALQWPIVYTATGQLSSQAKATITQLGASNIVIVGGTKAVSQKVEQQLGSIACVQKVERVQGADRIQTANQVYRYGARNKLWSSDKLIVASASTYADALSVSPVAYEMGAPLLLTGPDGLDTTTKSIISSADIARVYIAGGSAAVPKKVDAWVGDNTDAKTMRLAGSDRYATSAAIALWGLHSGVFDEECVAVASGLSPFDALASAPLLGSQRIPLLLGNPNLATVQMLQQLSQEATPASQLFLGGSSATPASLRRAVVEAFGNGGTHADVSEHYVQPADAAAGSAALYVADAAIVAYESPDEEAASTGTLAKGTTFKATPYDAAGQWLKTTVSGKTAYIPNLYATPTANSDASDHREYHGTSTGQTVYQHASFDAMELGTLEPGTKVAYRHYDAAGQWLTVSYDGATGYIANTGFVVNDVLRAQLESIVRAHPSLRKCFDYLTNHEDFEYLERATMPSWDGWEQAYAQAMIADHGGNCHSFAALFSLLADIQGYDSKIITAYVQFRSGRLGPHGWVEVYVDGQTYVCDPESQYEFSDYNFFMTTYDEAKVHYVK